jgi:hypothetical protein
MRLGLGVIKIIRVEAESNTSTVILRVLGGHEKGSLKPETVKYGHESQKTDPSSRQRGRPTKTRP